MKEYTIGEIHRKGLLLNSQGKPYKDKASVSNRLKRKSYKSRMTPFGLAKYYEEQTIDELNRQWESMLY